MPPLLGDLGKRISCPVLMVVMKVIKEDPAYLGLQF